MRLQCVSPYTSSYGTWKAGQAVEVNDDTAGLLLRDSPGSFVDLDDATPEEDPDPMEDMTIAQLREVADAQGIDLTGLKKRDEILARVREGASPPKADDKEGDRPDGGDVNDDGDGANSGGSADAGGADTATIEGGDGDPSSDSGDGSGEAPDDDDGDPSED